MKIAVIGLGYVGLPLSLQFARSGVTVLGLDIDPAKVNAITEGRSYIKHIEPAAIQTALAAGQFSASTDFARVKEVESVIICVPTPLNKNREPDISYIIRTGEAIAPHLTKGVLVVLESTTYPGTTDEDLLQVLEKGSGLKAASISISRFRPSAKKPGQPGQQSRAIPKVVGGLTQRAWSEQSSFTARPWNASCRVILSRGRSHQLLRTSFASQYRFGERVEDRLRRDEY